MTFEFQQTDFKKKSLVPKLKPESGLADIDQKTIHLFKPF